MILVINTINRNSIKIGIYQGEEIQCFEFKINTQSEDLLVVIEGVLKREKLSFQDIDSILVNQGPGSYTGVRIGVTVANALAWSLNIPVFGFKEGELDSVLLKIKNSKIKNFKKPVLPYY